MSLKRSVLSVYRRLLTVQKKSFAGDTEMIRVGLGQTREQFRAKQSLTNPTEIQAALAEANDAIEFISKELMQLQFAPQKQRYGMQPSFRLNHTQTLN